jgi:hypothetical protein
MARRISRNSLKIHDNFRLWQHGLILCTSAGCLQLEETKDPIFTYDS